MRSRHGMNAIALSYQSDFIAHGLTMYRGGFSAPMMTIANL